MARRRSIRRSLARYRPRRVVYVKSSGRKRFGMPSIAGIMSIAGPQLINNSGTLGTYPAIANALAGDYNTALWNLSANEVMAFTGYDVGKGTFNLGPPALTYGVPLVIKLLRRVIGGVRVGPVRLI